MTRQIFRQSAIDRLTSPEHLDRPARIVARRAWVALAAFVAVIVAAGTWVWHAEAPVKIAARGILIDRAGLAEIVSSQEGSLAALDLVVGQRIEAGDEIAELSRPDLERDLAIAQASLEDARRRAARLNDFYAEQAERETAARMDRETTIAQSQDLLRERMALLDEKNASVEDLVRRRVMVRDRLIDLQLQRSAASERMTELEDELKLLALRDLERESERQLALLDEQLKVRDLEREVRRLEAQLAADRTLRSRVAGTVVEIKVGRGDVIAAGQAIATLSQGTGAEDAIALVYVAPEDGKRVQPGMRVEIQPAAVSPERYGYIVGVVESVAALPSSLDAMRRTLRNDQLVEQLSGTGAPFEVRVRPEVDTDTQSGFAWSSGNGPATSISAGTLLTARVVADRARIAELILPQLQGVSDAPGS